MQVQTYATFEEMFGRKSTLNELIRDLKHFSRWSVLFTCSVIGIILKLWERSGWAEENYDVLIDVAFEPLRGGWFKLAKRLNEPTLVFHRRQLLFLMKLAIEHCPVAGYDLLAVPPGPFGTILLMASDHFHHGLFPYPGPDGDDFDKISRLVAEFLPVNEYSGFRVENKLTRAHLMMTRYSAQLREHPDYIDIPSEYERVSGISLRDYQVLTMGLIARITVLISLEKLRANSAVIAIKPIDFHQTLVPQATIEAFFREFADTSENILQLVQQGRQARRDFGANDFTVFRKKPLITEGYASLPSDVIFVIERFETGPYWRINSIDTATGDKLRRFWGPVFEAYVNDLIRSYAPNFIPAPHLIDKPNEQLCDGLLVEGDALVVMEYKASMFTAESKYSGDYIKLREEIAKKLVRDSAERSKKGVEQLAAAVKTLFADPNKLVVQGLDVSQIKRVYPLLLTLDDVGSSLLISRLLGFSFDTAFQRDSVKGVEIKPLLCTDIESLEVAIPNVTDKPLSDLLQHWLDKDPQLLATLMAHFPELALKRNEFLDREWEQLTQQTSLTLFNRTHPPRVDRSR
jgi:hypothetical protein